ncbi:dTDP-4-dehydrorhamnose 3,5-epimerase [Sphingosinicella rhizophila]|uniref:dTDP-4-dehydrorhamnose 3,5-epimerase n=1 Tax=Sphingosinicella rhizophila TaxID=3050082 RepID=A0ABU3Q9S6_9SPHN|nr:dTDP-4-dehydrorhamnose 3,5-epimerase [Sphingosinicella sp. GR2756]MDT9599695.1 dTDP-4-dehydrorhamnose 3,5-epimerase [Sphingosinicella sp. GR2756]
MLDVRALALDGVFEIRPRRHGDDRGFFSEVWSREAMGAAGLHHDFVQDNHSYSAARGVLRGLHFQLPPAAQDKLVRVSRGAIFDVAVDIRKGSPTFGKWVGLTLSADLWNQILVPQGFAHGFVTLEPDTEVQYKVSAPYRAEADRAIRFDDPDIGIDWPVPAAEIILSSKDRDAASLAGTDTGFHWR